jgi:hypothetical protein
MFIVCTVYTIDLYNVMQLSILLSKQDIVCTKDCFSFVVVIFNTGFQFIQTVYNNYDKTNAAYERTADSIQSR